MVSVDLSKGAKLKRVIFLRKNNRSTVKWIAMTLRTVESRNLQNITLFTNDSLPATVGEAALQEWKDLDRLLVQFWTSHSIRPEVVYRARTWGKDLRSIASSLLPELSRRELVDLVETP